MRPTFYLGLPYVSDGPLLTTARSLNASVLISANALSVRRKTYYGGDWLRFRTSRLPLLNGMNAQLDSAGFAAHKCYGAYPWTVDDYMDLCAAHPWEAFYAMDYAVEPDLAGDGTAILDRISETVGRYRDCARAADRRGILDLLRPVIQGWKPADYLRCLDRLSLDLDRIPVIGVGSVCRRNVYGPDGALAIIDAIDRELGSNATKCHLFGLKGPALAILSDHPRVASFDSQAYGITARRRAHEAGISKTNVFLASVMREWYVRQIADLERGSTDSRIEPALPFGSSDAPDFDRRINIAREEIRELVEACEIDAHWLHDEFVFRWAFDDTDDVDDSMADAT